MGLSTHGVLRRQTTCERLGLGGIKAAASASNFGLSVFDVPVAMPPRYEMVALQGPLTTRDPAVIWLIDNLAEM